MKIGIFGGTFDPVHMGHIKLAQQAREELLLDKIVFVPNWVQPFKTGQTITSGEHRLAMLKRANQFFPAMEVDRYEIDRKMVSYTIDTLEHYRETNPEADLYFLMGADAFLRIEEWKDSKRLLREYGFVIGNRPGYEDNGLPSLVVRLQEIYNARIHLLDNPLFDLNSTTLRERVRKGESLAGLVPLKVEEYILNNRLYGLADIEERIYKEIPEKRKQHTIGVVNTAMKLAEHYGADLYKTRIAALYHDYCKDVGIHRLDRYVEEYELCSKYKNQPHLSHGKVAAERIKKELGIEDEDVLNALRYHTTGRKGMSLLEKVIYLADAIEPNRVYPGVEELRERAWVDLDEALLLAINQTISYVEKKGCALDQDTLEAQKDLQKRIKEKVNG
jgi:nicotinate-nucleotide adenylyltransferase